MSTQYSEQTYESMMFALVKSIAYIGLDLPSVSKFSDEDLRKDERIRRLMDELVRSAKLSPTGHTFTEKRK